jgi:hypothetical protein
LPVALLTSFNLVEAQVEQNTKTMKTLEEKITKANTDLEEKMNDRLDQALREKVCFVVAVHSAAHL